MLSPNPGEETHERRKDDQLLCKDESGSATRMSGDQMACGEHAPKLYYISRDHCRDTEGGRLSCGALSKVKGLDKLAGGGSCTGEDHAAPAKIARAKRIALKWMSFIIIHMVTILILEPDGSELALSGAEIAHLEGINVRFSASPSSLGPASCPPPAIASPSALRPRTGTACPCSQLLGACLSGGAAAFVSARGRAAFPNSPQLWVVVMMVRRVEAWPRASMATRAISRIACFANVIFWDGGGGGCLAVPKAVVRLLWIMVVACLEEMEREMRRGKREVVLLCSSSRVLVSVHKVWFVVLTSDLMLNSFGKYSLSFAPRSDLRLSLDSSHSFSHMMTGQVELIKKTVSKMRLQVDVPSCPVFVEISKWSGDMVVVFLEPCPSLCPRGLQYRASFLPSGDELGNHLIGPLDHVGKIYERYPFFSCVLEMIEEGFLHVILTGNGFWLEMYVPGPCGIRQGAAELL
ncbi:hypothetical protein Acr_23g0008790 [Actinidia rufa]|uniref:Uncharacterized protein n=1 Tax=Actinidia rufa TaxID=165716 RepID=A0A7J0GPF3_9ERIC|nr:hypothetical protein Acr_23g0008790 [Actinidia rufa]